MFKSYAGKRVFVTGHTGFKGGWLTLWLELLGARVQGFSLPPETEPNFYSAAGLHEHCRGLFGDIRDLPRLEEAVREFRPELIFHLAAQPLVRRSYHEPLLTYQTNVLGSLNVLEAARRCGSVRACLCVTTDKCYENAPGGLDAPPDAPNTRSGPHAEAGQASRPFRPFREDDPLGGHDMYSSSKACMEIMCSSFRRSFLSGSAGSPALPGGYLLATARAGNVIGGGDWAEDRLLPDCIRAIESGRPVTIRNPEAQRPWQFVLEPLAGYLALGAKLLAGEQGFAQAFNFGPDGMRGVAEVARYAIAVYGKGSLEAPPRDQAAPHEAERLQLDSGKAAKLLGWRLQYGLDEAVQESVSWYKALAEGRDMREFSLRQIERYAVLLA